MSKKRKTLQKLVGVGTVATAIPQSWVKPVLSTVVLPSHAETSACMGSIYNLEIVFTEVVNCSDLDTCFSLTDEEILNRFSEVDPLETFCITDQEISAVEFRRNIITGPDGGGDNPVSDAIVVTYTIETVTTAMLSGSVIQTSLDQVWTLAGTWTATAA